MIVLDTDHISVLQHEDSPDATALLQKLAQLPLEEVATSAVTLEEQARSWLSLISRYSNVQQQVAYYDRFISLFDFFADWQILRFDDRAAAEFQRLRKPQSVVTRSRGASPWQIECGTTGARDG